MRFTKSIVKPLAAVVTVGAVVAVTATLTSSVAAQPSERPAPGMAQKDVREAPDGKYIVGLSAAPVALYHGGVDGITATASRDGVSLDRTAPAISEYRAYLDDERAAVLETVPGVEPFYEYDWAYAGFAAKMTFEQARALAATPGVAGVFPNEMLKPDTDYSHEFLGLSEPGGLWDQAGGPEGAGEGVVVGIIDTGITPESGSFAPLAEPAPVPPGWAGTCEVGDPTDLGGGFLGDEDTDGTQAAALACDGDVLNNKVIGARYFVAGFGTPNADDFLSPRDVNGHGSHTGSTSGGDYGVEAIIDDASYGDISGMAPRARVAMYKVCWEAVGLEASGGCASGDSVAAIDTAVADGVDVINYSISGSLDSANDSVATAFRGAAAAGIFVAASAGNSGAGLIGISTVAHNYPWVTTVAASTQARVFTADVVTAEGDSWTGSSLSTGVPSSHAIFGGVAFVGDPRSGSLCLPGALDPEQVKGKIVVCWRGTNARVQKSQVVKEAGGIGLVLMNDVGNGASTIVERHSVPTVHVSNADGNVIVEYVGGREYNPDAMLELTAWEYKSGLEVTAPAMASFSSRGPALMAQGDILKPDITAPGVDVLASLAPYDPNYGQMYGFLAGTSMSSPHIAGIGAMMKQLHPDWSPMAIKSAIMTGAYQDNNQGEPIQAPDPDGGPGALKDADPFNFGAGHVNPQAASATPLVYNSTPTEWVQWMCGTQQIPASDPQCLEGGSIDPSDLNSASIAVNDVTGARDIPRTVTNPTAEEVFATVSIETPPGFDVTVAPEEITVPPGGTATYTVTIEKTDSELDIWKFGSVTWETDGGNVRSALAVKAASFSAAPLIVSDQASGSAIDTVRSGIEATIDVVSWGLDEAQLDTALLTDPTGGGFPADEPEPPYPPHIMRADVVVPADAAMARFELFPEDYPVSTDLDLFVYLNGMRVGSSAGGTADEKVTLIDPVPGEYHVYVDLWALAPGEEECEAFLHSWAVEANGTGDFTVTPEEFEGVPGGSQEIVYAWTGLEGPPAARTDVASADVRRYLGIARYLNGEDLLASTMLRVDVGRGDDPTTSPPPTTEPPTTEPPTTTPVPTTTLPDTGGGDTGLYAGLGLGALLVGGLLVAMAARRLRSGD